MNIFLLNFYFYFINTTIKNSYVFIIELIYKENLFLQRPVNTKLSKKKITDFYLFNNFNYDVNLCLNE
ncbi:hypothetical protein PFAG_04962 [Plasmodium falciparum Santa Lucia]|uniref:Uncharacterized protein n=4 Tax=Plasmodium falciparum TaxID=5833 RepID=A0A024W1M7_PLAFA|nr:hypothetical protein PFTANZ_04834 [Plasmodium falciparum Tanzania (2000708)]ETW40766.1 hypothetical protein PFNF135_05069 [Plasmodium falciparum NF135/5.C10]EUR65309.1 hypothetical protein PFBG_04924 [Plasmodium falciparum 7G8]EUT80321.1 hypothetical protein PFAG_04962 [Plasmodium falciparum Santa Lucia]